MSDIKVNTSVDYENLCFLESHLMHELKRKGKDAFVKEYSENIDSFRNEWDLISFCFLLGLLGYLDETFSYDESIKLDSYVLNPFDYDDYLDNSVTLEDLLINSLNSFKLRNILYSEVGDL